MASLTFVLLQDLPRGARTFLGPCFDTKLHQADHGETYSWNSEQAGDDDPEHPSSMAAPSKSGLFNDGSQDRMTGASDGGLRERRGVTGYKSL
jgi:hypothetical protein